VADLSAWTHAFYGFVAFGLTASGTYVINDLRDIGSDREHATKRNRPIASGRISRTGATGLAVVCLTLGLSLGFWLGPAGFAVLVAYVILTIGYTIYLKRLPVVDVLAIASLFSLRL